MKVYGDIETDGKEVTNYEDTALLQNKPQTVTQETGRLTLYLIFSIMVVVLGSFQYGYNVSVTNTPQEVISNNNNMTETCENGNFIQPCVQMDRFMYTTFSSSALLGALVGALVSSPLIELTGRRWGLVIGNFFLILGNSLIAIFSKFPVLVLGRLFAGLGVGFASIIVPAYISEVTPKKYRGALGAVHQLMIVFAIMCANLFAYFLSIPYYWRFLFGVPVLIAMLQIVLLIFIPESPVWLHGKGRIESSDQVMEKLRGRAFTRLAPYDKGGKGIKYICSKIFRLVMIRPIFIGILIHSVAQFSGVNAIIFYSTKIFRASGIQNAGVVSVVTGVVFVISTLIGLFLMERLGRKTLFILSSILSAISFIGLSLTGVLKNAIPNSNHTVANVFSVIFVFCYIFGYSIGLG